MRGSSHTSESPLVGSRIRVQEPGVYPQSVPPTCRHHQIGNLSACSPAPNQIRNPKESEETAEIRGARFPRPTAYQGRLRRGCGARRRSRRTSRTGGRCAAGGAPWAAAGEGGGAGHGLLLVVAGELDHLGAGGHRRRREATAGIDACQSTRSPPFFSGGTGQGARFADLGFRWELVACARGLPRVYFRPCSLVACVEFEMAMQLSEKMTLKTFLLGGK